MHLPGLDSTLTRLRKWKSLLHFARVKDQFLFTVATAVAILSGALEPAMSIFFARFFDAFSQYQSTEISDAQFVKQARTAIFVLAGLSTAIFLLRSTYMSLWILFGETQAKVVRQLLIRTFLATPADTLELNQNSLDMQATKLQICVRDFQLGVSQPLGFVISNAAQAFLALTIALCYEWRLALLIFSAILLTMFCLSIITRKLPLAIEDQQFHLNVASKTVAHVIDNIATVKCFNAEKQERSSYCRSISLASTFYVLQAQINAIRTGFTGFAMTLILVLALFCASELIHHGLTTSESTMTTFFSCLMAAEGFQNIMPFFIVLDKGVAGAVTLSRVLRDIQQPEKIPSTESKVLPASVTGNIVFKDVSFTYPARPDHFILRNVNVDFPAGRLSFIIGQSGSGKSTVIRLMQAKHKLLQGLITIDGHDIRKIDRSWIRNNVTCVFQYSNLFNESVSRNVLFGALNSTILGKREISEALEFGRILGEVSQLPEGFQTILGTGDSSLSGGQKQRLILARTYLRDAPILILDEPTAALDPQLRSDIMANIRTWRRDKTTIVVTHDLTLINETDFVCVLNDGTISIAESKTLLISTETYGCPDHFSRSKQQYPSHAISTTPQCLLDNHCGYQRVQQRSSFYGRSVSSWYHSSILDGRPFSHLHDFSPIEQAEEHRKAGKSEKPEPSEEVVLVHQVSKLPSSLKDFDGLRPITQSLWPNIDIRCRAALLSGLFLAAVYAACPAIFSYLIVQVFENWRNQFHWQHRALQLLAAGIGVAVLDGVTSCLMHFSLEWVAQTWIDTLRSQAFACLLEQPKGWFDMRITSAADVPIALTHDAEELRNIVGRYFVLAFVAFIMMAVALLWSFKTCWKIAFVITACIPVLYGVTKIFQACSEHWEGLTSHAAEKVHGVFSEILGDLETIHDLTLETYFHRKYLLATNEAFYIGMKRGAVTGVCYGVSESAIYFMTTAIFAYGASLATRKEFEVTAILQAFALLLFSTSNASSIIACIPQISNSVKAGSTVLWLMSLPPDLDKRQRRGGVDQRRYQIGEEGVVFSNFCFKYQSRPTASIFQNLSLHIAPHTWTAIVGPSGSGKSTIASLLMKLYDVNSDTGAQDDNHSSSGLQIFRQDIREIDTAILRSTISVVPQTSVMISGTIRENILYGNLSRELASDENMYEAAKVGGIHDFILTLPRQYDTHLGDGEFNLSGGQAQRIAIARAIARNPSILILDEATSALDNQTAREIRNNIAIWARNDHLTNWNAAGNSTRPSTIISITHDIEMMKSADHIVLISKGTVEEEGSFGWLMERKGLFWQFLNATRTP